VEDAQIDLCKRCGAPTFQADPDKVRIDREGYVSGPRSSSGSTVLGPGKYPTLFDTGGGRGRITASYGKGRNERVQSGEGRRNWACIDDGFVAWDG